MNNKNLYHLHYDNLVGSAVIIRGELGKGHVVIARRTIHNREQKEEMQQLIRLANLAIKKGLEE